MRAILIAAFGLICLAGFYYGFQQNQKLLEGLARPGEDPLAPLRGEIRGLEILRPDAEPIRMEARETGWRLDPPLGGPVDPAAVAAILSALDRARPLEKVAQADPVEFGFQPPQAELVFLAKPGEEPVRVIQIGHTDSGQRGRYVRLRGSDTAYLLSRELIQSLAPELSALRDRALLRPPPEQPRELAWTGPEGGFRLIREDGGWTLLPEQGNRSPADPYLVAGLLEELGRARLGGYLDSTPPDKEALTLRLVRDDRVDWLRLWPDQEGRGVCPGRSSYQEKAFSAPARVSALLGQGPDHYRDRRIMVFDPREAGRLTLTWGNGTNPVRVVVEKSRRGIWRVVEQSPGAPALDQARGSALAGELARLRHLGPARGRPGGEPDSTVIVESSSNTVLAGMEAWTRKGDRAVVQSLGPGRTPRGFFFAGPEVFEKLPQAQSLTNGKKERTS